MARTGGGSHPVARRRFTVSSILRFWLAYCGSERPTGEGSVSSGKAWAWGLVSTNEDCLAVSDPRTTTELDMSVSWCLRERRIEQFRSAADGGNGSSTLT